jgi:hypothetical protein
MEESKALGLVYNEQMFPQFELKFPMSGFSKRAKQLQDVSEVVLMPNPIPGANAMLCSVIASPGILTPQFKLWTLEWVRVTYVENLDTMYQVAFETLESYDEEVERKMSIWNSVIQGFSQEFPIKGLLSEQFRRQIANAIEKQQYTRVADITLATLLNPTIPDYFSKYLSESAVAKLRCQFEEFEFVHTLSTEKKFEWSIHRISEWIATCVNREIESSSQSVDLVTQSLRHLAKYYQLENQQTHGLVATFNLKTTTLDPFRVELFFDGGEAVMTCWLDIKKLNPEQRHELLINHWRRNTFHTPECVAYLTDEVLVIAHRYQHSPEDLPNVIERYELEIQKQITKWRLRQRLMGEGG